MGRHLPILQLEHDVWVELLRVRGRGLQLSPDILRLGDDLVNVAEVGDVCQMTMQRLKLEELGKMEHSLEVTKVKNYCTRVKIPAT